MWLEGVYRKKSPERYGGFSAKYLYYSQEKTCVSLPIFSIPMWK